MTKRRSKKQPYLPFYPGDWKRDSGVQALEFFDRHVWFEMLLLMHDSEQRGVLILNGKPLTIPEIARLIGLDIPTFEISLSKIEAKGIYSKRDDGAIFNRKMVSVEELSTKRSIAGSMGGNPILLNQIPELAKPNIQANADIDIDIDSKDLKKNSQELSGENVLTVPIQLKCTEIIQAISNWQIKLFKQGRVLDQQTLDAQLAGLGLDKKRILEAINHSVGLTKCLNLIEKPDKTPYKNGFNKQDPPKTIPASESQHPAMVAQRRRDAEAKSLVK